jgi:hypothetical protein
VKGDRAFRRGVIDARRTPAPRAERCCGLAPSLCGAPGAALGAEVLDHLRAVTERVLELLRRDRTTPVAQHGDELQQTLELRGVGVSIEDLRPCALDDTREDAQVEAEPTLRADEAGGSVGQQRAGLLVHAPPLCEA